MVISRSIPPLCRLTWHRSFRIIPSRYPPIDLFERIADPSDWEDLAALEMLTNSRVRDEIGEITLVPLDRRVSGPGASWVMAAFTHPNPRGSRFSDGSFGVYYAGNSQEVAIAETVHHMGKFYAATSDRPHREDMRVLVGAIDAELHDIRSGPQWQRAHDPDDYSASQALAKSLRGGSNGIAYNSVRYRGGENFAAFWPDVVKLPIQGPHLQYDWDGSKIGRYYDYSLDQWFDL